MTKSIVIAERDNIAAVFENNQINEFFINKGDVLMGDVYMARVDNILPSIEAAFVDVGYGKMGFLHAEDVTGKGALKDKLSPNQKIMVQVTKEPTGHKGPRVTMSISLPGRFLVLMPQDTGINVSKKIVSSKERARLKSVLTLIKPVGVGVIVRTEAEGQSEADIQEDMELLLEKWNAIVNAAETIDAPNLIYRDQDLLYKVIREACTEDIDEITVDTAYAMHRVQQLVQNWHMNKNIDIKLYKGSEPLLVSSGIIKEIKSALQVKVNLPSGGYLFIQQTEALTVIDVNSGKFVSSATQDITIKKTNLEAIAEIARQMKLRNIGGMIIIDFIDMTSRADKLAIMTEFELALESDKAKPQIGQLSDLGLVELTRHRQGQTLHEIFTKKCPHCQGTGYIQEEIVCASSTSDDEYKAKASKLKLPVQQGKQKFNKFNNKHNNKFNKNQNQNQNQNQNNNYNNNQQPKPQEENIEPQIQLQLQPEQQVVEIEPTPQVENTVVEEVKPQKNTKKKTSRKPKTTEEKAEIKVENKENEVVEVTEEKPKRTTRTTKTTKSTKKTGTKTTKSKKKNEE